LAYQWLTFKWLILSSIHSAFYFVCTFDLVALDFSQGGMELEKAFIEEYKGNTMHILSIGYSMGDERVDCYDFVNSYAFYEYDVIIAEPSSIWSDKGNYLKPIEVLRHLVLREKEVDTFFENNGLCIVFIRPPKYHDLVSREGGTAQLSSYDWLPEGKQIKQYISLCKGRGEKLTKIENSAFTPYFKQEGLEWDYCLEKEFMTLYPGMKPLAISGKDMIVGAEVGLPEGGKIVFLPYWSKSDEEVLLDCIQNAVIKGVETPPPDWMKDYQLPGEKEKDIEIEQVDSQITELGSKKLQLTREKDEIVKYKKLLYETGKLVLEPVVRDAFKLLGFNVVDDYEPTEGSNLDTDGLVISKFGKGILEIKGRNADIGLDDLRQVVTNTLDDLKITKESKSKRAILVGNGFRLYPPSKRDINKIFEQHVRDSANRQSVALLNTVDLYDLVVKVLEKEDIDLEEIQKVILNTNGVCKFR
jgi:hypothetical protein